MSTDDLSPTTSRCLRIIARIVALAWAAWWTFFVWVTVASEGFPNNGLVAATILTVVFLGSALIVFRSERIGGLLLTVEGILVLIGYPQVTPGMPSATVTLVLLTLALPPLIAGTLSLACRGRAVQ